MARLLRKWNEHLQPVHFVAASTWVCTNLVPTAIGLHYMVQEAELSVGNTPVEPDTETLSMTQKETTDTVKSAMSPWTHLPLLGEPFVMQGSEAACVGSMKNRSGARIGVPYSWRFSSTEDIEDVKIMERKAPNSFFMRWKSRYDNWLYGGAESDKYDIVTMKGTAGNSVELQANEDAENSLRESLILSENAKRFAYCREIEYAVTRDQINIAGIGVMGIGMAAVFGCIPYQTSKLMKKPMPGHLLPAVIMMQLVSYSLALMWFRGAIDQYMKRRDKGVDKRVANKGAEFVTGGVEYYEKLLQKNKAVLTILGSAGEKMYTEDGNVIYKGQRSPHVELTKRRDALATLLEGDNPEHVSVGEVQSN